MVRGTGAVVFPVPAVVPCVMMRATVLGCVLRGWIAWWIASGALLPGANSRQEKCHCHY